MADMRTKAQHLSEQQKSSTALANSITDIGDLTVGDTMNNYPDIWISIRNFGENEVQIPFNIHNNLITTR